MIARRILTAFAAAAVVWRATEPRQPIPELDAPTREYEVLDLDEAGPRVARQIHGRTASELAAADRAEAWEWARIEAALSCDADFRELANRLTDEFPDT